jgi:hypothetical protein
MKLYVNLTTAAAVPQALYQDFLATVLAARLPERGQVWLRKQLESPITDKALYLAFSLAPRFTGKASLQLTDNELRQAQELRPGFDPAAWTTDQAARTLLLLRAPQQDAAQFTSLLDKLFGTGDVNELATLYASLPLLPYPEAHAKRAAEGVRTTMTSVFDAIALHNPYPHDYLPQEAWNQLVLKAVFNARPLYQIVGLDDRRNEPLAHMLLDYAHERWAAGRTLTPEVWRLVGPYLTTNTLPDVQRLLHSTDVLQVQAGALALAASGLPEGKELLKQFAQLPANADNELLQWQLIGEKAYLA